MFHADFLRTMKTSEDTSVYDKVVNAIFDEDALSSRSTHHHSGTLKSVAEDASAVQHSDVDTEVRDHVIDLSREVFRRHCAKHLEIIPLHLLDDCTGPHRCVLGAASILSTCYCNCLLYTSDAADE